MKGAKDLDLKMSKPFWVKDYIFILKQKV